MTLSEDGGKIIFISTKLNTQSSTKAKLVAVDDVVSKIVWAQNFWAIKVLFQWYLIQDVDHHNHAFIITQFWNKRSATQYLVIGLKNLVISQVSCQ